MSAPFDCQLITRTQATELRTPILIYPQSAFQGGTTATVAERWTVSHCSAVQDDVLDDRIKE